jgi:hypothetical protein
MHAVSFSAVTRALASRIIAAMCPTAAKWKMCALLTALALAVPANGVCGTARSEPKAPRPDLVPRGAVVQPVGCLPRRPGITWCSSKGRLAARRARSICGSTRSGGRTRLDARE